MVNVGLPFKAFTTGLGLVLACTLSANAAAALRAGGDFTPKGSDNRAAKALNSLPVQFTSRSSRETDSASWHLVRTPGPEKSGDTVSLMRTADLLYSDPDFAGMAIRCQEKSLPQIGFVVVQPFKPRSKARVTVATGQAPATFEGIVIGPGSIVALPDEAGPLLRSWQAAKSLQVEIAGEGLTVKGTVALGGLSEALTRLETSCPR